MAKVDERVIIIGSGIAGLVCGCYLAKAGKKVLIVEQHSIAGGYCTSFKRKGYVFDVGPHYLGSLRNGGVLSKILLELDLWDKLEILRSNITDKILIADDEICFSHDHRQTTANLIRKFPREESGIRQFISLAVNSDFLSIYAKAKGQTFKSLLDDLFDDYRIKSFFSIPLACLNLPSSRTSALVAIILFREFFFDGGYYIRGGMQQLPNALVDEFKGNGGEIQFSTKVTKIRTNNNKIVGVETDKGDILGGKCFIANCDATMLFSELLDVKTKEYGVVSKLKPSDSAFVLYLGLKNRLELDVQHFASWYFADYDVESRLRKPYSYNAIDVDHFICVFSSLVDPTLTTKGSAIKIFLNAKYAAKEKWDMHKERLGEITIDAVSRIKIIPNLKDKINVKIIGTPCTFNRYTSNREGALFGWMATPEQSKRDILPYKSSLENLYLTGHWTTNEFGQSGIALVALSGMQVAKAILRE